VVRQINRRKFLSVTGAAAATAKLAKPAVAQQNLVKIGLMTVKTGGLAAGGVHLEEGITCFLKDKNFTLAGRKIELVVADTAGVPATAKAKAIELVEQRLRMLSIIRRHTVTAMAGQPGTAVRRVTPCASLLALV